MIQRIQSIYLFLAGLFPAFTYFVPLIQFVYPNTSHAQWFYMNSLCYDTVTNTEMVGRHPWGLILFTLLAIILPLVTIFGYKNRKRQIKLVKYSTLVNVIWYITIAAYTFSIKGRTLTDVTLEIGCLFPLLSIITLFLAQKGIKHDEAMVRAADRIR